MSRSKKKNIAGGWTTAISEKKDKQFWHRAFRRSSRMLAKKQHLQDEDVLFPVVKEKSNPWTMSKDGKTFYIFSEAGLRKDIDSAIKVFLQVGYVHYYWGSRLWILGEICEFLKIPKTKTAVSRIKQRDIEQFIRWQMKTSAQK